MKNSRTFSLAIAGFVVYLLSIPYALSAHTVVPSDRVKNFVSVREDASSDSNEVGRLNKGESAEFVESVPRWYKVKLSNGQEGYVPKSWTTLVTGTSPGGAPTAPIPFEIHFLDVGTGDSAIIDMGDKEVVIDGGDSITVLHDYAKKTGIIQGPVELVIVTHGDSDHWKGLVRLLNFDGKATEPKTALEFWEPGYNRDCRTLDSYDNFIKAVRSITGIVFKRPLENSHQPAVTTGQIAPFTIPSLPNINFSLLYSSASPPASNNDCAYQINNASIVLKVEINGITILFTGDANGKERDEPSPGTPGHVEQMLLALEKTHPGTLKADILKVPHHGSETASTQEFIDKVNPQFVVISASTRHHLPKGTVVRRYDNGQRVILRTDANHEKNIDHIICASAGAKQVDCNFKSVLEGN